MAEVYAGFLAHADHHIGRLLDYLEETGQRENTLVILVSDNGASGEGGPNGSVNENRFFNGIPDDLDAEPRDARRARRPEDLQPLPERLGDGLQHAVQDVEALRVQRRHGRPVHHLVAGRHEGQGRDPRRSTTTRSTSCRRSSTASASRRPQTIKGHVQSTFDGVSMRYSFDDAKADGRAQDAVLLDARLARHLARGLEGRHHPSDDRRLEPLQRRHLGALPHRRRPLRAARPRRRRTRRSCRELAEPVVRRGRQERRVPARRPLAARDHPDAAARCSRRRATATSTSPTRPTCPEQQAVNIRNRSFAIGALVDIPAAGAEGVLFAHGARFGGHALYVKDNRLHYVNSFVGIVEQKIDATEDLPTGEDLILSASFDKDGEDPPGVATGILSLYHGDKKVGEGRIKTQPGLLLARRRGPLRRPRQRRGRHRRLPGRVAARASPAARSSGSPSTSAASPTSTSSAKPWRC